MASKYTTNQDIRDYMEDQGVRQRDLAMQMGVSVYTVCATLKKELTQKEKEDWIRNIDAVAASKRVTGEQEAEEEAAEETVEQNDVSIGTKFQIGDRVKIPAKGNNIGTVCDIWHSLVQSKLMYAVDTEGGHRGLYAEDQLEPAPIPVDYSFEAHVEGNVAVVTMIATQGEKTWIYARGHAHILHDGAVGMAQAVSFAAKRMFESLDAKNENPIYLKEGK